MQMQKISSSTLMVMLYAQEQAIASVPKSTTERVIPDLPEPQGVPKDIGEAAQQAGVNPYEADAGDWQKVLYHLETRAAYHLDRSCPERLQAVVDKKAKMHTTEGYLFGKSATMRVGTTGKKGRQKIRQSLKPADVTWQQFYKDQKSLAGDCMDIALDISNILDSVKVPMPVMTAV